MSLIAAKDEVLAIAVVSKTLMPVRISARAIVSQDAVVFATSDFAFQALLSSSIHQIWVIKYGSGMRKDPRYTPSDVFETFPLPRLTKRLREAGERLESTRRALADRRQLGLTEIYNLVNSRSIEDADIVELRDAHIEADLATLDAYGWSEIAPNHGFHTYRQMDRWMIDPDTRFEVLDRLLEENHRRAKREAESTPASKMKRHKSLEESPAPEGAMF